MTFAIVPQKNSILFSGTQIMTRIVTANELRPGHFVEHENDIYEVKKYDFSNQTRSAAIIKLVLKNIHTGTQKNLSVDPAIKFNAIDVAEEEFEYMYDDGDSIFTMDGAEFPLSKVKPGLIELISQARKLRVIRFNDEIYTILLPKKATVKIKTTEPVLRGQTAGSAYKPATLYNGWTIQVPLFIEEEDEVIIDTTDLDNPKYDSRPS